MNFWDDVQQIDFSNDELPSNLYSEFTGKKKNSFLQYCLPANYSKKKNYPLIVYVTGFHGHAGGNIQNAIDIANNRDCIVASLPLFKANIDRTEYLNGMLIGFADYPVLDEMDFSEREFSRAAECWKAFSLCQRAEACHRYRVSIFAARRDEVPQDSTGELVSYLAL